MISTVPTLASLWPADFLHGVRLLILGGEVCPVELADRLTRRGMKVWNTYGPTEATVVTCAARLSGGAVRIGLPLDGWRVAVVDPASGRPVRWGEIGELRADPDARHPAAAWSASSIPPPFTGTRPARLTTGQEPARLPASFRLTGAGRAAGHTEVVPTAWHWWRTASCPGSCDGRVGPVSTAQECRLGRLFPAGQFLDGCADGRQGRA